MFQRLQDTDVFVLMEFSRTVKHMKGQSRANPSWLMEMKKLGEPFHKKLMQNGHSAYDAADMMRSAWNLIEV